MLVKQMGFNVPKWFYLKSNEELNLVDFNDYPYIIKLAHEGSGIGISDTSVVYNPKTLKNKVIEVFDTFQRPIIIQKYIEGIELTIGVVGSNIEPEALGLIEITLNDSLVYGISQKENSETKAIYTTFKNYEITQLVQEQSKSIFSSLGCRDAARLDFRLDANNIPYFLEINLLPHLHPVIGDFCRSAYGAGYTYKELLNKIMNSALLRYQK
jgi:D-alanine-D-alanine ligase